MTEPRFTPGPWVQAGPSFGYSEPRYSTGIVTEWEYEDNEPKSICYFRYDYRDEENEANAHLIAAAPELYEALEMMWDTACTNASSRPSKQAFLKAQTALAKARGEA